MLNQCHYCVDHHFSGMSRLINNPNKADNIKQELKNRDHQILDHKQQIALDYAQHLTVNPGTMVEQMLIKMRDVGWTDGEILEINQVAAYFNYANRTVLGLGVHIEGDVIGLSPNNEDNPDDWNHQ